LLYRYVRTLVLFAREVGDAVVDEAADAFQELDPGVAEMVARGVRPHPLQNRDRRSAKKAAGVGRRRRGRIGGFFHFQLSFISTVRTLFSNLARLGERPAIEVGRPMWRRSVPTCTTNSSPFLNSPTSPLAANGNCRRTS